MKRDLQILCGQNENVDEGLALDEASAYYAEAMFDAFTTRNFGRNAETGLAGDKSARRYAMDIDSEAIPGVRMLTEKDLPSYLRAGGRVNKYKSEALAQGKKIILTSSQEVREYIEKAIAGDKDLPVVAYGKVSDRLADDVEVYSKGKINIRDYYLELVADDIRHSHQEHLYAKENGDIDLSTEDFVNIPGYVADYDDFVYVIKYKSGATKICVSKKNADGRVILIETVSKSHGSIEFKNMIGVSEQKYIEKYAPQNKNGNSTNTGGSVSSNTSPPDETVSKVSISQPTKSVKSESEKNSGAFNINDYTIDELLKFNHDEFEEAIASLKLEDLLTRNAAFA